MLGVGSVVYLPESRLPPILDVVPMAIETGAIDPDVVVVSVMNSWALIYRSGVYICTRPCRSIIAGPVAMRRLCTFNLACSVSSNS